MANTDQNITELPIKTASEVLDADYMLGIDLVEGYQVSTKDFADYAVNRAAISIGGKTQTTASAISEVRTTAGNAQPKESGKGLSANDFTNAYKSKLDGIAAGAEVNVQSDWNASSGDAAILHKPTTISGYGITDAYTKTQVDTSLAAKSDKSTTYTKTEVDDIVNVDEDTSEAGNPISIETDAAQYAKKTHLTLEPVQDLHGYDHPWPAGGGKNLLQYPFVSTRVSGTGVTFTVRDDGSVVANGTVPSDGNCQFAICIPSSLSGRYKFTGISVPQASIDVYMWDDTTIGRPKKYDRSTAIDQDNNGTLNEVYVEEGHTTNIVCRIGAGITVNNYVFHPMICAESEIDPTFEPYSNICPITPMGHMNLLPMTVEGIKAANGGASTWLDNTKTINGVTFTIMADDESRVVGIKANGTASANTFCNLLTADFVDASVNTWATPTAGGYTISSGNTGGSSSTYGVGIDIANHLAYCLVCSGYTANNLVFKPMLRLASDSDSTFVPYGMARVGAKAIGKNLFGGATAGTYIETGEITHGSTSDRWAMLYIPVESSNYCFSANDWHGYKGSLAIFSYDANKNFLRRETFLYANDTALPHTRTFSVHSDAKFLCVSGYNSPSNGGIQMILNGTATIQLELGSTATEYEPYTESVSSVDLSEPVYGGTLDLETGEVVADMGMVDLGTLTWGYASGENRFYALLSSIKSYGYSEIPNIICSRYKTNAWDVSVNGDVFSASGYISVKDNSYNDATTFTTAMSGVQLCYELATPVTYQLTPQQLAMFKGINNISTNAKTVKVTYRNGEFATTGDIVASTEVAKQNAIGESASYTDARLATELAPILGNLATAETSPASASHAVGEYLLYNNRLYKVLAAISAGQQLTIGTNVGQTNVAAELASQANAISALNSKTSIEALNISIESGITNNLFVRKQSGIVTINGYLESSTAFGNNVKVANIPEGSRPFVAVRSMCALANAAYDPAGSIGYVSVSANGDIYVSAPSNNTYKLIYFSLSYMAQV